MDTATMAVLDHRHNLVHIQPSMLTEMPPFDISMPVFTALGAPYLYPVQYPNHNYNAHVVPAGPYDTFAHYSQQPLVTPGPVFGTVPDGASIAHEHYASSKPHDDLQIKAESRSPAQTFAALQTSDMNPGEANFGTHVDTLMRAIQNKTSVSAHSRYSLQGGVIISCQRESNLATVSQASLDCPDTLRPGEARTKKTYKCDIASCAKHFFQKTHLEIHMRAHTGYKPFVSIDTGLTRYMVLTCCVASFARSHHAANAFRNWETSRPMSDGTQASDHIRAMRAASDSHREATSGHIGLSINKRNHFLAGLKDAENNLPS